MDSSTHRQVLQSLSETSNTLLSLATRANTSLMTFDV